MDASSIEISNTLPWISPYRGLPEDSKKDSACNIRPSNGTTGGEEMQDRAERGLRVARSGALKIVWQKPLFPLADLPDVFPSVMRFPSQDVLNPAHDTNDEACHASPSRDLATHKLTLDATRACDKSDSFHLDWLNEVLRGGRPGMRMISIAPRLIKPLHAETLHADTHQHTHHHHGPDVHHDHKDSEHHSHDAPSHSSHPRTEPKPASACRTEVPHFSRRPVAVQARRSVITDDGDDTNDSDDIDIVAAILRDAEQPDTQPQLHTRRRGEQLAVLKVLEQRRSDLDATQLERQRFDFESRFTTPSTIDSFQG